MEELTYRKSNFQHAHKQQKSKEMNMYFALSHSKYKITKRI
ncbi:hypothetical protein CAPGI0001_2489 [Capnocytophaga gingivalis ATCC 33624]|nr:hypothetical protein CAPGI0001_2489 [Capnocytophaga gingivalis ATCC 33624]